MNSYEYQENRSKLSEAERVSWLRKNWALQIDSLDVLMLCELAAKGLERASLDQPNSTTEEKRLARSQAWIADQPNSTTEEKRLARSQAWIADQPH